MLRIRGLAACVLLSACAGASDETPQPVARDSAGVVPSGSAVVPAALVGAATVAAQPAAESSATARATSMQYASRNVVIDSSVTEPRIERRDGMYILVMNHRMWQAYRDSFPTGRPLHHEEFAADVPRHLEEALFAVVGDFDGDSSRDVMFLARLGVRPGASPDRAPYVAKIAILTRSAEAGPVAREVSSAMAYRDTTQPTSAYLRGYPAAEWQDVERRPLGRLTFAAREWSAGMTQSTLLFYRDGRFHESIDAGIVPPGTTPAGASAGPLNSDSLLMVDDPTRPVRYARPSDLAVLTEVVRAELTRRECSVPYAGTELTILRGAFYAVGPKNDWAVRCSRMRGDERESVLYVFGAGRAQVDSIEAKVFDTPAYRGGEQWPHGVAMLYSGFHVVDGARVQQYVRASDALPEERRRGAVTDAIMRGDIDGAGEIHYWDGRRFVVIGGVH